MSGACGLALGCALAPLAQGQAVGRDAAGSGIGSAPIASATVVQCQTTGEQAERSVTFAGEMNMVPGAMRMSMRIELQERGPEDAAYHTIASRGLGVWRTAAPGVTNFRHLDQVTDLYAPALYRALVIFRWQGPHRRLVRRLERRTSRCEQPALPSSPPAPAPPNTPAGAGPAAVE